MILSIMREYWRTGNQEIDITNDTRFFVQNGTIVQKGTGLFAENIIVFFDNSISEKGWFIAGNGPG